MASVYGKQAKAPFKLLCWWCGETIRRGTTYIRRNAGEKDILFHPNCEREMRAEK